MSYLKYNVEDFAADPNFRKWVLEQDVESNYFWEKWMLYNPDKRGIIEDARALVLAVASSNPKPPEIDPNILWAKIDNATRSQPAKTEETRIRPIHDQGVAEQGTPYLKLFARVAAVLLVLFGIGWFALLRNTSKPLETTKEATPLLVKAVPPGQKVKMYLPDGSVVILNSSSTLQYPKHFDEKARKVKLTGEAHFEIAKDSLAPFIVEAGNLSTEVLGTSFNVRAYPHDTNATVSLLEGSVRVTDDQVTKEVILAPGEEFQISRTTGKIYKGRIRDTLSLDWTQGVLSFKDVSLRDAFVYLERWYGVEFRITGNPGNKRVTGVFEDEYLSNVLESIQYTGHFDFKIEEDTVYIEF